MELNNFCTLLNERESAFNIKKNRYISTENMLPDKGGIKEAASIPYGGNFTKFQKDDVLISNIRPYFKKIWRASFDGLCSPDVLCLRNKNNIDALYFYYLLSQQSFFDYVMSGSKGCKMPRGDKKHILKWEVELPPLPVQKKIAAILSALDEKIETNRKINARLEELAQAIFKSWFIDFTPFGGQMPQDWERGILSDYLLNKKNTIKASEVGDLPYLPIDSIPMKHLGIEQYDKSENAKSSLISFSKNDILIGAMRVYFHRVVISPFDGVTRTTCFVLQPKKALELPYLLLLCNQPETIDYANKTSKGTTMPYAIWENGLANLETIMPSNEILERFYKLMMPIISKIRDVYKESKKLSELRDTLLPKLISGKIKVH